MKITQTEVDKFPTILELLEEISKEENVWTLDRIDNPMFDRMSEEGRLNIISPTRRPILPMLFPCSQTPFTFFRGESSFHQECIPTIYRGNPTEEDIAISRLKVCEFGLLLERHPAFVDLAHNYYIDYKAVAQHYGLNTNFLDITNNKWVAAFFATTRYIKAEKRYEPVGRDYEEGYGVLYVTKPFTDDNEFFKKQEVIGYCYFERPARQFSFGYKLDADENLNKLPYFEKRYFRHDKKISELLFAATCNQKRFIPNDELSSLADVIINGDAISYAALEKCEIDFYPGNKDLLIEACVKHHIVKQDKPVVNWNLDTLQKDWVEWNNIGRADLQSRINQPIFITHLKI